MSQITITKEDGPRNGRYVARIDGIDAEGEITFTHRGQRLVVPFPIGLIQRVLEHAGDRMVIFRRHHDIAVEFCQWSAASG